jgi:hypothetical protein
MALYCLVYKYWKKQLCGLKSKRVSVLYPYSTLFYEYSVGILTLTSHLPVTGPVTSSLEIPKGLGDREGAARLQYLVLYFHIVLARITRPDGYRILGDFLLSFFSYVLDDGTVSKVLE